MMQLDYPSRINEMGAFVNLQNGNLLFNRHYQEVPGWHGKKIDDLLVDNADLSQVLMHCQPQMDVDYVAAASLLIRAPVAKQAGLWMDFFIHFDDVEWCLRIAKAGHRIAVSAKSLIWHLSAAAKVPNWILYYDNRNVLYLLDKYSDKLAVKNTIRRILKKYLYYQLIGKADLAELHVQAIADFEQGIMGKKAIQLPYKFEKITEISRILNDPAIKKIIVPWTINMQASNIENIFVSAMKNRPELQVFYIVSPHNPQRQLTNTIPILMSRSVLSRYLKYFCLRNQFDIALQSDYQTILPLSWIAKKNLFTNDDEYFCLRPAPQISRIIELLPCFVKKWYQAGK